MVTTRNGFFWRGFFGIRGELIFISIDSKSRFPTCLGRLGFLGLSCFIEGVRCNSFVLFRLERVRLLILSSENESPCHRVRLELTDRNPFMTLQVVVQQDLSLVHTFNNEEMMRWSSLNNKDTR